MIFTSTKKSYIDPRDLPSVDRATLKRVFVYLRPYRWRILLVAAIIILCAMLNLIPPLLVKEVVDHAIPDQNLTQLWWLCVGMVAGPLLAGMLQVAQKYLTATIGEQVMLNLRVELFAKLHEQPLQWFAAAKPGEALSRVLNDVQGVGSVMSGTLVNVFDNTIVLLSSAVMIIALDWRLSLIALPILPLFVAPTRRVGQKRKRLRRSAQEALAELTGILVETLSVSGALLMKVFGAEKFESARLKKTATNLMDISLRQTLVGRWFQMLLGLFEAAGPAMIFAGGGWLIINGQVQLGTVIAFVAVLRRLYQPATQLANVHVDVVTSYAYFERIFSVLDMEPSITNAPGATSIDSPRGKIEFRHVSFSYGRGKELALRDISLTMEPGHSVAIVGASGSGKSTLAGLVPRLYDPTEGAVLLDGRDLRTITQQSLRSHIAVVLQETYLFHGTVLEVEAAARTAQIHEFIAALPDGYNTIVGERGYQLSGGERQRVAIARAILKNPRILILDEATSSLDSTNEKLVQAAIEPLLRNRTSLVIAHRLSTIAGANLIVVLKEGSIVERGTHDELLRLNSEYAEFFRRQSIESPLIE